MLSVAKGYGNIVWENLLLAFIGEQFSLDNEINGVAITIKPNFDSVQIWNRTGRDMHARDTIK